MEVFAEYFRHLYYVDGATSVYLLTGEIPNEELYQDIQALPVDRKLHYLERAREKSPPTVREILKCAQVQCLIDNDLFEEAASLLRSVQLAPRPGNSEVPNFSTAITANVRAVRDELRKRGGKAADSLHHLLGSADDSTMLLADLEVVLDCDTVKSRDRFSGRVRVRNVGTTTWNLLQTPVGTVNLGAHLLNKHGDHVIAFDFLRNRIGAAPQATLAPGEEVLFLIEFQPPIYGRYVVEFDLVSEMVCWFARNGSKTVRIPIVVT
jgi:hypothetical protein